MKTPLFLLAPLIASTSFAQTRANEQDESVSESLFAQLCDWYGDDFGELYEKDDSPWIEEVTFEGRFHYQIGRIEGDDVRGNSFSENFDEFRRTRLTSEVSFLKFFELTASANFVDDGRFNVSDGGELAWGFDDFNALTLDFDWGKAFGKGPFDDITLSYGLSKLKLGTELHLSSNNLLTLERTGLADTLGGEQSRPTGVTIELEKDDWTTVLGVFANDPDRKFIQDWSDGVFFYGSLEWAPNKRWTLRIDHAHANQNRADTGLGYQYGSALSVDYDSKRWGITTETFFGRNNDDDARDPNREGFFYGLMVLPRVWLVKDQLQLVGRYQYAAASESEGFQLPNRYLRALHEPPNLDLDNGFGDENHSFYLGLNWSICDDQIRVLPGIAYETLNTSTGSFSATTYSLAFRTHF